MLWWCNITRWYRRVKNRKLSDHINEKIHHIFDEREQIGCDVRVNDDYNKETLHMMKKSIWIIAENKKLMIIKKYK